MQQVHLTHLLSFYTNGLKKSLKEFKFMRTSRRDSQVSSSEKDKDKDHNQLPGSSAVVVYTLSPLRKRRLASDGSPRLSSSSLICSGKHTVVLITAVGEPRDGSDR